MNIFRDQTGKEIKLENSPTRIVSLVPSQTELLYDLGLDDKVVGITKFCVHPDSWFRNKTRVGGTKSLHIELIKELKPDLVIANKEENLKSQVEEIENFCPVWTSDISTIKQACEMILKVGELTTTKEKASSIIERINQRFQKLKDVIPAMKIKALYLIWQKPFMAAGGDTFISEMLNACGFENALADEKRYPEISSEEIKSLPCDLILLSSEPFPFTEKHVAELSNKLTDKRILKVDGELFSWYGSRMLQAPEYFTGLRKLLPIKGSV